MRESSRSLLIVVAAGGLVGLLLLGGVVYVLTRKGDDSPFVNPYPQGTPPPETQDPNPGEKILQGADRAFHAKYFETALKFYRDFELRYAGTETFDAHIPEVWEKIAVCDASMPKRDETLPGYLEQRKKLDADWRLLRARPAAEAQEELRKFLERLPPQDGRRALVDARLGAGTDKK